MDYVGDANDSVNTEYILKVIDNDENTNFYIVSSKYGELLDRVTECSFTFEADKIIVESRRTNSVQFIKYNSWEYTMAGFVSLFVDGENTTNWSTVANKMYVTPSSHDYCISLIYYLEK